jgi:hypothetical protein
MLPLLTIVSSGEGKQMPLHDDVSRRNVLRRGAVASGAVLFGGATVIGRSVAQENRTGLASQIEGHGHYAWFPLGPESWGRSTTPYDMQDGESRWLAQPQSDGSVRCLARNLGTEPPNRNTGFDVHLGRLGTFESIAVTSRTLQTARTTGPAALGLGLYLDKDDNDEFLTWEDNDDGTESSLGPGNDDEGFLFSAASGELTIDGDTAFRLLNAETEATLAEMENGSVEGITGETAAALYVGVVNAGEGMDEIVVEDVHVQRR